MYVSGRVLMTTMEMMMVVVVIVLVLVSEWECW